MVTIVVAVLLFLASPVAYMFGKNHERDIQAMKQAGRAMRKEQKETPVMGSNPEWLADDGSVKPFPDHGPSVTEYPYESVLRNALTDDGGNTIPLEGLRTIRGKIKGRDPEITGWGE